MNVTDFIGNFSHVRNIKEKIIPYPWGLIGRYWGKSRRILVRLCQ